MPCVTWDHCIENTLSLQESLVPRVAKKAVSEETARQMYSRMVRIRRFEETAKGLLGRGELYGGFHTSVGQEASIVGACVALEPTDYMVGTHRSHGHPIGKGADLGPLLAELLGRAGGVNQGYGGSMHMSDFSVGSLGETSIVGSGFPVATGAALGSQLQGDKRVSLCFFGEGAANEGTFHESLNLAAVWDLPVIYLCENNGYGELTAADRVMKVPDVAKRAAAYGMPGVVVDGQDVLAVYEAVRQAVRRARSGKGPTLVETKTYRFDNHGVGLPVEHYRTAEEIEMWMTERDPLDKGRQVLSAFNLSDEDFKAIEADVERELEVALEFARASPAPVPEDAFKYVYTDAIEIDR
jgi:acetoin:2,6-dichlorophenolindophenol oxidoreductase subunit alpha